MDKKKLLILAACVIVIIGVIIMSKNTTGPGGAGENNVGDAQPVDADPVDTVMDFYGQWLRTVKAADNNPFTAELMKEPVLSDTLAQKISAAQGDFESGMNDPVLCTTVTPEKLRTKIISHEPASAQILMLEGGDNVRALAVVKLVGVAGQWQIEDIDCNAGEEPPAQGEYSFEQTGFLLGPSVSAPLDPSKWYVVYEKDGLQGFTAILNFNETSQCLSEAGDTIDCVNDQLGETMEVSVQGDMQETGVDVVNLRIVDDRR